MEQREITLLNIFSYKLKIDNHEKLASISVCKVLYTKHHLFCKKGKRFLIENAKVKG